MRQFPSQSMQSLWKINLSGSGCKISAMAMRRSHSFLAIIEKVTNQLRHNYWSYWKGYINLNIIIEVMEKVTICKTVNPMRMWYKYVSLYNFKNNIKITWYLRTFTCLEFLVHFDTSVLSVLESTRGRYWVCQWPLPKHPNGGYLSIFYDARFSGQKFYTAKVRNLQHCSHTTCVCIKHQ